MPDAKKFVRFNSLGVDYTEDAILERISGQRVFARKRADGIGSSRGKNRRNIEGFSRNIGQAQGC